MSTENKTDRRTLAKLLAHYATGEARNYAQFDGWINQAENDYVMKADKYGHSVLLSRTQELRHTDADLAVRVLVHEGTSQKDAAQLLKRIHKWVKNMSPDDWRDTTAARDEPRSNPSEVGEKQGFDNDFDDDIPFLRRHTMNDNTKPPIIRRMEEKWPPGMHRVLLPKGWAEEAGKIFERYGPESEQFSQVRAQFERLIAEAADRETH